MIIPVHNAMPYLLQCLQSVVDQTIGTAKLEVIAVDDGSTDGSGEALDEFAAAHPGLARIVHQEASGTPSAPRNLAFDMARGRYVQVLDADDYLGPETLKRSVAMAEANDSDVVLQKIVSVGGRTVAGSMFHYDQPRADLYSSRVYWSLGAWKLYRRDLLEKHRLRFRTDRRTGEDRPFVFLAYYHARNISVIGDYDCYYMVQRDDGGNLTTGGMRIPEGQKFNGESPLEMMAPLVCETVEPGPKQDYLMSRHWEVEGERELVILRGLRSREEREVRLKIFQGLLERYYTEEAGKGLHAHIRLCFHLARRGDLDEVLAALDLGEDDVPLVGRDGRLYAVLPGHEAEAGIGDGPWVEIGGEVGLSHWLDGVETDGKTLRLRGTGWPRPLPADRVELRLELRHREQGVVRPVDLDHVNGRFTTEIDLRRDLGPLEQALGVWDIDLVASIGAFERRAPFGASLGKPMRGNPFTWVVRAPRQRRAPIMIRPHRVLGSGQLAVSVRRPLTLRAVREEVRRAKRHLKRQRGKK
ncbi:glycosyltransferase family 2 protein [Glycomyces tritici]|uniref:Glycosyltransferase family 2 protein n=1 Tax=Glycomyces tritici TaxID=2665176 RepID=A0ABT7YP63_9ACTN|nr:glycosyltransferase family 2 protein [Glycomyces tritici]MDN3240429.1 glycosyltransferase family 2 protein [Glycomyces tritici]